MLRVFYGDDRTSAQAEIKQILGEDYEVFEGEDLALSEMDSVFFGTSLFVLERKILLKDLGENKACFERLPKYKDTEHAVIVWESKLDKRSVVYKELVKQKIEIKEFKAVVPVDARRVFDVFEMAWRGNAEEAVDLCEKIKTENDPYRFFGLIISQALKKLNVSGGVKAQKTLKVLADYDLKIKSTGIEPWVLIKACLFKLSSL